MLDRKTKQPREVLDFDFDASRRLGVDERIASASAFFSGPDSALVIEKVMDLDTFAKVWVSGGTDGATYKITVVIRTTGGRTLEKDMLLVVKEI